VDADQFPHPQWCIPAFCTIERPPVNGFQVGMHRSAPSTVDALVLRLVQPVGARVPRLELRFGDERLAVPLVVAQSLAPAVDDLLAEAGVGL
jgi:hypothetical protein